MGFEPFCPNQQGFLHRSAPQRIFYIFIFPLFQKKHQPSVGGTGRQQVRASPWKHLTSSLCLHLLLLCTFQNIPFWRSLSVDALGAESLPPLLSDSFGGLMSGPCHVPSMPLLPYAEPSLPAVCRLEFSLPVWRGGCLWR